MARTSKTQAKIPLDLQPWIEARNRFRLSHAHVQMARELGLNPKKLGKLANQDQEPWKLPLQDFIVKLYMKRFGRGRAPKSLEASRRLWRPSKPRSRQKRRPGPPHRSRQARMREDGDKAGQASAETG